MSRVLGVEPSSISPSLAAQLPAKHPIPVQLSERLASADEATRKLVEIALYEDDDAALQNLSPSLRNLIGFVKQQIAEEIKHGRSQ